MGSTAAARRAGSQLARATAARRTEAPATNVRGSAGGNTEEHPAQQPGTNKLLRIDEMTMAVREVELPRAEARPRRLQPTSDGRIWYVDYAGGRLGAYDPAADSFQEWQLPGGADARPYAIAVDDQDRLWIVETTRGEPNTLVGFDPATERFVHAVDIPSGGGTVRHMVYHAPTRAIWFGTDANTVGVARLPR